MSTSDRPSGPLWGPDRLGCRTPPAALDRVGAVAVEAKEGTPWLSRRAPRARKARPQQHSPRLLPEWVIKIPWFKVDDQFAFHRKVVAAGNTAIGLWARAGSWSAAQLTDGHVPQHMVATLGARPADAKRLVQVGLWHEAEGGYQFHQWNDEGRQPARNEVEAKRAEHAEKMRRWRDAKKARNQSRDEGVTSHAHVTALPRDASRDGGVTHA